MSPLVRPQHFLIPLALASLASTQLFGAIAVYTFGDGLGLDGSSTVNNLSDGVPQGDLSYSPARTDPPNDNLNQTAIVTDANNGFAQVPDGGNYNPYFVGRRYGSSNTNYRTTMTFDLSSFVLPTPPPGETQVLDSVQLWLEISGTPTSTGGIDIFEGDFSTSNIPVGTTGIGSYDFSTDPRCKSEILPLRTHSHQSRHQQPGVIRHYHRLLHPND